MTENQAFDLYRKHPPFCHLTTQQLNELSKRTKTKSFKVREKLFKIGDKDQTLLLIEKGQVQISSLTSKGKPLELQTLRDGDVVGEVGFITKKPHATEAIATTPTTVLKLPGELLTPLIMDCPQFLTGIIHILCHKITYYRDQHWQQASLPLRTKLARKLIHLSVMNGESKVFTSQEALAHSLGSCRESVARCLRIYRNSGILITRHSEIEIINFEALKKIAGRQH